MPNCTQHGHACMKTYIYMCAISPFTYMHGPWSCMKTHACHVVNPFTYMHGACPHTHIITHIAHMHRAHAFTREQDTYMHTCMDVFDGACMDVFDGACMDV
jgi:hypothetical protein